MSKDKTDKPIYRSKQIFLDEEKEETPIALVTKKRSLERPVSSDKSIKKFKSEHSQILGFGIDPVIKISKYLDPTNPYHLNFDKKSLDLSELQIILDELYNHKTIGHVTWGVLPIDQDSKDLVKQIEDRIIQNNKEYKLSPNDFIHGLLSSYVYQENILNDVVQFDATNANSKFNNFLQEWVVHRVFDVPESGRYYAVIYLNEQNKQIVLAHRGTKLEWLDLLRPDSPVKTDIKGILNGNIVKQQMEAYKAAKAAVEYASENNYHLSITGHSLGAWLAELSTYHCYKDFGYSNIKAVTFDSPGSKESIEKFKSNIDSTRTNFDPALQLDIVTYFSLPNIVNSCNKHIGTVYAVSPRIITPELVKKYLPYLKMVPGITNNLFILYGLLSLQGHSLDLILGEFDTKTGKPNSYKQVLDWPEIQYKPTKSVQNSFGKEIVQFVDHYIPDFITKFIPSVLSKFTAQKAAKWIGDSVDDRTAIISILQVAWDFAQGNINAGQYWKTFALIDVNNPTGEYTIKVGLNSIEEFSLLYKGHYNVEEMNSFQDVLSTANQGSSDWYLSNLAKSIIYLKDSITYKQLKDLKEQYEVRPASGKEFILTKNHIPVDSLREWMQRIIMVNVHAMNLLQGYTYSSIQEDKAFLKSSFKKLYDKTLDDLLEFIKKENMSDQKLDIIIGFINYDDWKVAKTAMKVVTLIVTENSFFISDREIMQIVKATINNYKNEKLIEQALISICEIAKVINNDMISMNLLDLSFSLAEAVRSQNKSFWTWTYTNENYQLKQAIKKTIDTVISEAKNTQIAEKALVKIKLYLNDQDNALRDIVVSNLKIVAEKINNPDILQEIFSLLTPVLSDKDWLGIVLSAQSSLESVIKEITKYNPEEALTLLIPLLQNNDNINEQKPAIILLEALAEAVQDNDVTIKALQLLQPLLSSEHPYTINIKEKAIQGYIKITKESNFNHNKIQELFKEAQGCLEPLLQNEDYNVKSAVEYGLRTIMEATVNIPDEAELMGDN